MNTGQILRSEAMEVLRSELPDHFASIETRPIMQNVPLQGRARDGRTVNTIDTGHLAYFIPSNGSGERDAAITHTLNGLANSGLLEGVAAKEDITGYQIRFDDGARPARKSGFPVRFKGESGDTVPATVDTSLLHGAIAAVKEALKPEAGIHWQIKSKLDQALPVKPTLDEMGLFSINLPTQYVPSKAAMGRGERSLTEPAYDTLKALEGLARKGFIKGDHNNGRVTFSVTNAEGLMAELDRLQAEKPAPVRGAT